MSVWAYITRKLLYSAVIFFAVSLLLFAAMHAVGDPIQIMLGQSPGITPAIIDMIRRYYGLDQPLWYQYFLWMWRLLHFDLGVSVYGGTPVNAMVVGGFYETMKLQVVSILLALGIAIPAGSFAAARRSSKWDNCITTLSIVGLSVPPFWMGIMLILVFAFYIPIAPSFGANSIGSALSGAPYTLDEVWHMILPVAVLTVQYLAMYVRLVRSTMLEVLRTDYVNAAKAMGLRPRTVTYGYALKNALFPLASYTGYFFAISLGSSPVTETVFSWPGLGYLFYRSIVQIDYPVIMAIGMTICVMAIGASLATDIAYSALDPRVKLQ